MAEKGIIRQTIDDLPPMAKTILVFATLGVVGFAAYRIYKSVGEKIKKYKEGKELTDVVKEEKQKGNDLSYSAAVYTQLADRLFGALNGYFSEKESSFEPVMAQMKNRADLAELIRVYGKRDVSWRFPAQSLNEAITEFFDDWEIQKYIYAPLNKNGVDYTGLI